MNGKGPPYYDGLEVMDGVYLSTCSIYSFSDVYEVEKIREYLDQPPYVVVFTSRHLCLGIFMAKWLLFVDCNRVVGSICVIEKLNCAGEELQESRSCSANAFIGSSR